MDRKDKDDEILEHTDDEIDEIEFEEQLAEGECEKEIPEYYFSNPAPNAKVTPRPADAPQRNFRLDEEGHIVVKNPSEFWMPDIKVVDEIGGTEFTVTGSYTGTEPLHKKLVRIMEQQADEDKTDITEELDET